MAEFIDYYALLGVSSSAKKPEIESAFKQKVMQLRPDINLDDKTREEFAKLKKAREVLTDPITSITYLLDYHTRALTSFGNFVSQEMDKLCKKAEDVLKY